MGPEKVETLADITAGMNRHIPKSAKLVMLDLVLAWARVDTTIAQLATAAFALDPTVGAVIFGRMPVPDRLRKMRELNVQLGRTEAAKALRTLKKQYEDHSKPRNTIAHAACVGFIGKPDRIVFLPFESEGSFGQLAIEVVPLDVMRRATSFAKHVDNTAQAMIDEQWAESGEQGMKTMAEVWCGDEKVCDWGGASLPAVGDKITVELDGEDYDVTVKKVFERFDKAGVSTQVIEISDPRPVPFVV